MFCGANNNNTFCLSGHCNWNGICINGDAYQNSTAAMWEDGSINNNFSSHKMPKQCRLFQGIEDMHYNQSGNGIYGIFTEKRGLSKISFVFFGKIEFEHKIFKAIYFGSHGSGHMVGRYSTNSSKQIEFMMSGTLNMDFLLNHSKVLFCK